MFKGHRKRFIKLVKMLVLYIDERYSIFFPRNKVTVVLKLALLASHMAKTLIENLRNVTSSLPNKDPKHSTVALFNLCYVFHIVFIKHIKWCIVLHTIVQRNIHQMPMIISDT